MQRHSSLSRASGDRGTASPLFARGRRTSLAAEASRERVHLRDDDAADKLAARLLELRARHGLMTRANTLLRRGERAELQELGLQADEVARLCRSGLSGFSEREIRSNAASIRRVERRIREVTERSTRDPVHVDCGTYVYEEDHAAHKVCFRFLAKPSADIRDVLGECGFKFTGQANTYARVLTAPALAGAACVRRRLEVLEADGTEHVCQTTQNPMEC